MRNPPIWMDGRLQTRILVAWECERMRRRGMANNLKQYRVWIEQVNQTYVDVFAANEESARQKGYAKWRKEDAHARVLDVQEAD